MGEESVNEIYQKRANEWWRKTRPLRWILLGLMVLGIYLALSGG